MLERSMLACGGCHAVAFKVWEDNAAMTASMLYVHTADADCDRHPPLSIAAVKQSVASLPFHVVRTNARAAQLRNGGLVSIREQSSWLAMKRTKSRQVD